MSEKLEKLISLLYQDKLTQYGKRLLVENIEKLQKENEELLEVKVSASAHNRILELEKENEELKEINNELEAEKNEAIRRYNFETIPKQKVKEKIEELENYIQENSDEQGYWGNINSDIIYGKIEILEESLEESED